MLIIRKLLAANYIFGLFSWIVCDSLVFWMMKTMASTVLATREFGSLVFEAYIYLGYHHNLSAPTDHLF